MSSKFVQMMSLGWNLTFLRQGQICVPIQNVEKSFSQNVLKTNGWNVPYMIKVENFVNSNHKFMPLGL